MRVVTPLYEEPFVEPAYPLALTTDGRPWVRYCGLGAGGWYALGQRLRGPASNGDARELFWARTLWLAARLGNGQYDAAHALHDELSFGAFGISHPRALAALLHAYIIVAPEVALETLMPLWHATGLRPAPPKRPGSVLRGWRFVDVSGKSLTPDEARIRLRHTDRGRLWVECCSDLLHRARYDDIQSDHFKQLAPQALGRLACQVMGWTRVRASAESSFETPAFEHYTSEQQALWSLALISGVYDRGVTRELLGLSEAVFRQRGWQRVPTAIEQLRVLCAWAHGNDLGLDTTSERSSIALASLIASLGLKTRMRKALAQLPQLFQIERIDPWQ